MSKICECEICGEEDRRDRMNELDGVMVCDYCHQTGDYVLSQKEFEKLVIKRAKEIYPGELCTDFVKEGFQVRENGYLVSLVKGSEKAQKAIEETAQNVAFDSAYWNGDFPG